MDIEEENTDSIDDITATANVRGAAITAMAELEETESWCEEQWFGKDRAVLSIDV